MVKAKSQSSNSSPKKLISICIPILNEEENIVTLVTELQRLAENHNNDYDFEFVFTDNASTDSSWEMLENLSKNEKRISAYRFTRNIGFQNSILFNYLNSKGDAVIQLDADLQDPPALIGTFLREWEKGYLVVTGIRVTREENWLLNSMRRVGYWFIDLVSETPL